MLALHKCRNYALIVAGGLLTVRFPLALGKFILLEL
jgi:hypothetical protein